MLGAFTGFLERCENKEKYLRKDQQRRDVEMQPRMELSPPSNMVLNSHLNKYSTLKNSSQIMLSNNAMLKKCDRVTEIKKKMSTLLCKKSSKKAQKETARQQKAYGLSKSFTLDVLFSWNTIFSMELNIFCIHERSCCIGGSSVEDVACIKISPVSPKVGLTKAYAKKTCDEQRVNNGQSPPA